MSVRMDNPDEDRWDSLEDLNRALKRWRKREARRARKMVRRA